MRICSPQLGLAPKSILGGEVFDRQILLGLAKLGVKIEIILPKNKAHDQDIKNWHITTLAITHFPAILGNLLILLPLFQIFKKNKFEILRIHQPQYLGLGSLLFKAFNPEVKLIATFHQFRESNFWLFSKLVNRFWDHVICDSLNVKNKLVKNYNITSDKITVVHNGVPSYLKPGPKNPKLLQKLNLVGKVVLLFMGFFDNRKNPLFLLDVLSNLATTRSDIVVIFWGQGPLEVEIKTKSKKLGISDNIRILKPLFGKEKIKVHNLADIFVHPAKDEGFALSPLESMTCAKPIVMTRGYSAKEAVDDGINGFLAYDNDIHDWSEKLQILIKNRPLREKMGKASLAKVKAEFQWSIAASRHFEVFKKLNENN